MKIRERGSLPVATITVSSPTPETQKIFLRITRGVVREFDEQGFEEISQAGGVETILGFSEIDKVKVRGRRGVSICNPIINICRTHFDRGRERPNASKGLIVRHEQQELWNAAKREYFPDCEEVEEGCLEAAHQDAVRAELNQAEARGQTKEHVRLVVDSIYRRFGPAERDRAIQEIRTALRDVRAIRARKGR